MSPLATVIAVAAVFSAFAWIASLITGDTSQVDRLWSIVPVLYVWIIALKAHESKSRLIAMAVLVTAWGIRLTFNFARKGGYRGVEDYRWAVLRSQMSSWQYQIFNLFFIVIYQNTILVLITLPTLTAFNHQNRRYSSVDTFLIISFIVLLVGETIADQQQWNFYRERERLNNLGSTDHPKFLTSGLFRFSRHPNYFFEQAQWWVVYAFGAYSASRLFTWTIIGPILLTILFIGSTRFTEQISVGKYPEYSQYQRRTSAVIPWFPKQNK